MKRLDGSQIQLSKENLAVNECRDADGLMLRVVGDSKAHDDPEVEVTIVKATHDAIARMVENGKEPDLSLAG